MKNAYSGSAGDDGYETVSIAVVNAVATHRGVDPIDLPPLYEWIDPDAVDDLFEPTRTGGPRGGRLEFEYDGHTVAVDCTDGVTITIDGSPAAESMAVGHERAFPTDA